jgi:GxxExxY protein
MKLIKEEFTGLIIQAAIEVHKGLGPGFLECVYEQAMSVELEWRNIEFERQRLVGIFYRGIEVGTHRVDLVVANQLIVELKAAQDFDLVHFAQIKSYLKATGLTVGLLLNFNKPVLAIKRFVL